MVKKKQEKTPTLAELRRLAQSVFGPSGEVHEYSTLDYRSRADSFVSTGHNDRGECVCSESTTSRAMARKRLRAALLVIK